MPTRWQPSCDLDTARERAAMLFRARGYFAAHDILEVDSPVLSRSAVSDPQIESISAQLANEAGTTLYLHTSPEYPMKRLLCAGYPDMYSICKVFRDDEIGRLHQPEFTMIEWYRRDFDLQRMIDDTLGLIGTVLLPQRLAAVADVVSYSDAFVRGTGVDPLQAGAGELARLAGADASLAAAVGEQRDDWLNLIMARDIAASFASDRLTVVYHYPASQAALARLCLHDANVADRFEVFYGALELANGYVELTDVGEQERRFAQDQASRKAQGRREQPLDRMLLAAMHSGLPACAGVAAGLDRLLMINTQADDIRQVQSFAFEEQPVGN